MHVFPLEATVFVVNKVDTCHHYTLYKLCCKKKGAKKGLHTDTRTYLCGVGRWLYIYVYTFFFFLTALLCAQVCACALQERINCDCDWTSPRPRLCSSRLPTLRSPIPFFPQAGSNAVNLPLAPSFTYSSVPWSHTLPQLEYFKGSTHTNLSATQGKVRDGECAPF